MSNNAVSLKSGSGNTQCHWKWQHSLDGARVPIRLPNKVCKRYSLTEKFLRSADHLTARLLQTAQSVSMVTVAQGNDLVASA